MFFSVFSTKLSTIKVKENQRFMEFVIKVVKSGVFLFGICISVDTSCCSRHIYLRLSDCHWGEEKWRQAKLAASFILQAHFDEGAAAIHYGVHRASATSEIRFIRFLPVRARRYEVLSFPHLLKI